MILRKKIIYFFLFFFFIIAYCYNFTDIPHFRYDEGNLIDVPYQLAFHGHFGSATLDNGGDQTHYFHVHPPVYYLCLAAVFKIFGYGIMQARLFSMVLAFLSIVVFSLILHEIKIKNINLYLLGILSTPLFFVLAKTIRPEMMMVLLFTISFWLLIRWKNKQKTIELIVGGIVTSLMMMTHMFGLPIVFLWLYLLIRKKNWKHLSLYMFALVLPTVPYILWIIKSWDAFTLQVIVERGISKLDILQKGLEVIKTTIISKRIGSIFYPLVFFLIILFTNYKKIKIPLIKYVVWAVALFWLQFLLLPKFNELYVVLVIPLLYLIIAIVMDSLSKRYKILLFVLIGMICLNTIGIGMLIVKYNKYSYKDYEVLLNSHIKYNENTKIMGNFSVIPIFHEAQFKGFQTYTTERDLVKAIDVADYVIIDDFTRNNQSSTINNYIIKTKQKDSEFVSPYYGSEGNHPNNRIEVYKSKNIH